MTTLTTSTLAAAAGFCGGFVLGIIARWGRFCSLGAIEDYLFGGDSRRLRGWGVAISIAIAGTYLLDYFDLISLETAVYLSADITLPAVIVGSLLFGFGMALVGTCGYGTLARLGGGDLKSAVTFLVMGITAYATMNGATAYLRIKLFPPAITTETGSPEPVATISQLIASALPIDGSNNQLAVALCLALVLLLISIVGANTRLQSRTLISGIVAGLCITWGWYATGRLATDAFGSQALESYTYSAPLGESIIYLMTMTGSTVNFGIGATAGVVAGALLTSLLLGQFRWEACDDARELKRQILGGVLMGFGSVTALGCTVGQGLSAASILSVTAPVAIAGFIAGAWLGLRFLVTGILFWNRGESL